jgi:magnesium chelatase subunit D
MLLGTVDIEYAVADGKMRFSPGLLKRADGNILYIDEANLLTKTAADVLLDVSQRGSVTVEREGMSQSYSCKFVMMGTMNPEESLLGAQFTDRFGLYVQMKGIADKSDRVEIIKRRMEYEKSPERFCAQYKERENVCAQEIARAQKLLPNVKISDDMMQTAAMISSASGAAGHRAEIYIAETALAIAALDGRVEVEKEDIHSAAEFVLPHRIRECSDTKEEYIPQNEQQDLEEDLTETPQTDNLKDRQKEQDEDNYTPPPEQIQQEPPQDVADETVYGQELYALNDIFPQKKYKDAKSGSGRRSKTVSDTKKGRYIGFCMPKGKSYDIAFDATLRAAAPHQRLRDKNGLALSIKPQDIRQKRREHRVGNTIFFAVDASGSMGAQKRMIETKNAVLSLLYDAYQKRDRIGLIAFRKDEAEILLPVTRSIDLAQKRLQSLPTGGRTPLAKGLKLALQMIYSEKIKDHDMVPLLILITDGKVNDKSSETPYKDVISISDEAAKKDIPSIVIDTENSAFPLGIAKEIAEHMKSEYVKIQDIKAQKIVDIVRMRF